MHKRLALILFALTSFDGSVSADIVYYRIPGTKVAVSLQGDVNFNPGGTVTFQHGLGKLYMSASDLVQRHKVSPLPTVAAQKLGKAKDAESAMEAARWALKHGLLDQFYRAVIKALEYDPQHADANRVRDLKRKVSVDLGPSTNEESQLRKVVRRPEMKIKTSRHFILLYDTPDTPPKPVSSQARQQPPRAEARLELLEKVYEVFLMKFYSQGAEIQIPNERLMVVLFNDHSDYLAFATSISPELSSAIGFYDPRSNISFFFDHGSSEYMKPIRDLSQQLQAGIADAIKRKDGNYRRFAETISLLVEIDRENSDIEVVSHEATHQLAGNTGLLPRHVLNPSWVHEGLATYFEAPGEATWSGMGAVNERRIGWYRELANDREHSSLDFIVGDQIFKYAGSHGAILHGYGQAWALTHFLLERHFDEFLRFYQRLGEMPPDVTLSPAILNKLFDDCFQTERTVLEQEWKSYMRSLKTDMEIILSGG